MDSNTFRCLSAINLNERVEKKDNLTYLSWTWAWSEVKKIYPDATYVVKFFNGLPYVYDEATGYMVFTEVTIQGLSHTMWLPVMDGANRAMKSSESEYKTKYGVKTIQAATMFDINKALMRCLVKNLAMFGLGIYIYAGEDLPETDQAEPVKAKAKDATPTKLELKKGDKYWDGVIKYCTENKLLGESGLLQQLGRKYIISDEVKAGVKEAVNG
jgi:hypothetical protein